jgi:hypothetical protein
MPGIGAGLQRLAVELIDKTPEHLFINISMNVGLLLDFHLAIQVLMTQSRIDISGVVSKKIFHCRDEEHMTAVLTAALCGVVLAPRFTLGPLTPIFRRVG